MRRTVSAASRVSLLALGCAAGCASQGAPPGRAVAHANLRREPADRRASAEPDTPLRPAMVVKVERFVPGAVVACGERCRWFDVTVVRVVSPAAHAGRELRIHRERGRPRLRSSSPPAAGSLYTAVIDPRWLDEERWLLEGALSLTPLTERPGE